MNVEVEIDQNFKNITKNKYKEHTKNITKA